MNRRSFLAASASAPLAQATKRPIDIPIGLELYTVKDEFLLHMKKVVPTLSKLGYRGVEMWAPYAEWPVEKVVELRNLLDASGMKCFSTHTNRKHFEAGQLERVIDYNQRLGSRLIVMSSAGELKSLEEWKPVADTLSRTAEKLRPLKMATGFHNHKLEFVPLGNVAPIEYLAKNTPKDVVLQLDVGTCLAAGRDPIAWIQKNPGRIKSLHLKDWKSKLATEEEGYRVMLGEGDAPWKELLTTAVDVGGVETFLVEQEGSELPAINAAERCLENLRKYL